PEVPERQPAVPPTGAEARRARRPATPFIRDEPRGVLGRHAAGDEIVVPILEVLLDLVVERVARAIPPAHSRFSTAIGSIAMARCAGRYVATAPDTPTTPKTAAYVTGSAAPTPNRMVRRANPTVKPTRAPSGAPAPTSRIERPAISRITSAPLAPSAIRTPISWRRWPTENAVTP